MSVLSDQDGLEFRKTVQEHGHAEADFELRAYDNPSGPEGSACTGIIVVTHTLTFRRKIYPVGYGSRWIREFENDLERHKFHAI